jgi:hypothetical protein
VRPILIAMIAVPLLALACSPIPRPGSWRIHGGVPSRLTSVVHMVRLRDGRVFFLGRYQPVRTSPQIAPTTAIFDPRADRWTLGAPAPVMTTADTLTELADGSLLLAGGDDRSAPPGAGASSRAYLYFPNDDRWARVGDMHHARADFSATRLPDGRVLVAGGEDYGQSLASCEFYDPGTRSWSEAPSLPIRRVYQSSVLLSNGTVLLAGGDVDVSSSPAPVVPGQSYSPGAYPYTTEEIFDPRWRRWSTLIPPEPVEDPTVVSLPDGQALFTGGHFGMPPSPFTYLYNPGTGSWTRKADWKSGGYPTFLNDGRLLFLIPRPYTYDISQDLWMPATAPPDGYFLLGLTVEVGDRVLALASPGPFGQGGLFIAVYDPSGFPPLPGSAGALANPSIAAGLAIVVLALLLVTGLRYAVQTRKTRA